MLQVQLVCAPETVAEKAGVSERALFVASISVASALRGSEVRIVTDKDRKVFRELAEDGYTRVSTEDQIQAFFAWFDELGSVGEKRGYAPGVWKLHHSLAWLRDYEAGRSPVEVLERLSKIGQQVRRVAK